MVYSLKDFIEISNRELTVILPQSTIDTINVLSSLVGSPNYIKTPVFSKKDNSGESDKKKKPKNKYKYNASEASLSGTSGQSNIVFKTTVATKKEGIDLYIQNIRAVINKLVGSTVDDVQQQDLFAIIDEILESDISVDEIYTILENMYNILSGNKFYSKAYSKLFARILNKYEIAEHVFKTSFNKYVQEFNSIVSVDPEKNYDLFCAFNKQCEIRRSTAKFYVELYNLECIEEASILEMVFQLVEILFNKCSDPESRAINDEIIECLGVFFSHDSNLYDKCSNLIMGPPKITIKDFIVSLTEPENKKVQEVSSKSIFKLMDILELDLNLKNAK